MEIITAKSAGFCFGVKRAVDQVFALVEAVKSDEQHKIYCLGQLIHNPHINRMLEEKGVVTLPEEQAIEILRQADINVRTTIVIRTHGLQSYILNALSEACNVNPMWQLIDCTCPYVTKIHDIVRKHTTENTHLIIFGDDYHPEVISTISYAAGPVSVVPSFDELCKLFQSDASFYQKDVIIIAQTTQNISEWEKSQEFLRKACTNAKIFDTICKATDERQREAQQIADSVDLMLVIGGLNSANTNQLFQVAASCNPNSFLIQDVHDMPKINKNINKVGITAGASTPAFIIREVQDHMSEFDKNIETTEENFSQMLDETFKILKAGDVVTGVVTTVSQNELHVDIMSKATGVIPFDEISDDSSVKLADLYKRGDTIEAKVTRVSDLDGMATLSVKQVQRALNQRKVAEAFDSGEVLQGTVTEIIRGGVIVTCNFVKVFIPASQTGVRMADSMDSIKNKTVNFKVIEVDNQKKRMIGSIRAANSESRRVVSEEFWNSIEIGKKIMGTVKSLTAYGAFVDIGGVDGMVHNSELSWKKIGHPSQVVQVGQEVEVFVKEFDRERSRISLGYKTADSDPWVVFESKYKTFDTAEVTITSILPFGAFGEIVTDVDGLIHISQLANKKVNHPSEVVKVGDKITVLITEIDDERRKISLSAKALLQPENDVEPEVEFPASFELNAAAVDAFKRDDFEEKVDAEEVPATFSPQTETNAEAATATLLDAEVEPADAE